jgi:hypothetical protein
MQSVGIVALGGQSTDDLVIERLIHDGPQKGPKNETLSLALVSASTTFARPLACLSLPSSEPLRQLLTTLMSPSSRSE